MEQRADEVVDLILAGLTSREIHRWIREKRPEWDIQTRQRALLISRARKLIQEAAKPRYADDLGKALRRYDVLYRRSFTVNDYRTCADIVKKTTDLLGLAAPQRHEHTGKDGGPIRHESQSKSEFDSEIERLLAGMGTEEEETPLRSTDSLPPGFPEPL